MWDELTSTKTEKEVVEILQEKGLLDLLKSVRFMVKNALMVKEILKEGRVPEPEFEWQFLSHLLLKQEDPSVPPEPQPDISSFGIGFR